MAKLVERLEQQARQAREAWSRLTGSLPVWLLVLGALVAGAILGLLGGASGEWTGALIGLLGVALGGLIAAVASFALERERRNAQLAMATWAERVRAHQEAYDLWRQIFSVVHESDDTKRKPAFDKAYEWYNRNCLYLSDEARTGFLQMYHAAYMQPVLVKSAKDERLREDWEKIESLHRVLIEGAGGHISDRMLDELRHEHERQLKKTATS